MKVSLVDRRTPSSQLTFADLAVGETFMFDCVDQPCIKITALSHCNYFAYHRGDAAFSAGMAIVHRVSLDVQLTIRNPPGAVK